MKLTDDTFRLFEGLTRRPLLVIDTEFCIDADGEHIISLAVVPIIRGRRERGRAVVMNPGVAIDADTQRIHGFTDDAVAKKKPFPSHAKAILAMLAAADAVFVNHTNTDIRVLRLELDRLNVRLIEAGENALELPKMPLLDTSLLARKLDYPGVGRRTITSLTTLCELVGISRENAHDAKADATATASALIALLRHAASIGLYGDIDDLLDAHDRGTTHAPKSTASIKRRDTGINVPEAHLALHTAPLTHAASHDELNAWLELATSCITLRCEHLADEAVILDDANRAPLLDALCSLTASCTKPGDAGTLAGALAALLPPAPLTLDDPIEEGAQHAAPLKHTRALRWWATTRAAFQDVPRCAGTAIEQCPDCRAGVGCALDLLYTRVAYIAVRGESGVLDQRRIDHLLGRNTTTELSKRSVGQWVERHPEVAAWSAWVSYSYQRTSGRARHSKRVLQRIEALELWRYEPRVMLLACELNLLDPDVAEREVRRLLERRTTDPAYSELAAWLVWREHVAARTRPRQPKVIINPRLARPAGRQNANPYLPD